jgi:hypothetical protein
MRSCDCAAAATCGTAAVVLLLPTLPATPRPLLNHPRCACAITFLAALLQVVGGALLLDGNEGAMCLHTCMAWLSSHASHLA